MADAVGIAGGQNRREVWYKSWRGVVWEAMEVCNMWRKIVGVVLCYI